MEANMEAESSASSPKYSIVSVPVEYFQSILKFESLEINGEKVTFGLGSNTIIINENTSVNLCLNQRSRSYILWAVLKFNLQYCHSTSENNSVTSKRLVHIVIDQKVGDSTVVLSDDLLFNLDINRGQRPAGRVTLADELCLILTNECIGESVLPVKATKAVISLFQCDAHLENSLVDKILHEYFLYPRYLCSGDVFSIRTDSSKMLNLSNIANYNTIYIKVCELHCPQTVDGRFTENCKGYFIDSSVTLGLYKSNHQDFVPSRKLPLCYKPNLYFLLGNEKSVKRLQNHKQNLVPSSFDNIFKTLCDWMDPFLYKSKSVKGIKLNPVFLISGKNGSGKTLLLQALSQYCGLSYWRVDCVTVGGAIASQVEAKLKTIFNQLKGLTPCILHLSNIEVLCQDEECKEDIRVISFFREIVNTLSCNWPAVIMATTHSSKCVSPNMDQLFLDKTSLNVPDCEQREDILSWLIYCNSESIDAEVLQAVASQTSGFGFRDLQTLVVLAFKEKYKRSRQENKDNIKLVFSDFSKIIGLMHKAYSDSIGAPKVPSVSWKDVGGLEHLKKEILRSLKSNMFNTGLKRSGLLLHGPPGTGKTLLAKAVATQCGRNFLSVKGPELLNMYVGQSEHNVRDLFELAKAASPCIIFFDELDSLAPNRGRSGDSGGVMDRVVSQLLAEMDDLGKSGDVFILGATNRPDLIDPALLRPGRLDKLLYVGPCEDRNSQLSVITALTTKLKLDSDVNLEEIVSLLPPSVSGAQVSALCSAAWLSSARQSIQSGNQKVNPVIAVSQNHFLSALSTVFNHH